MSRVETKASYQKRYKLANKEKIARQRKQYYEAHKEQEIARSKEYRRAHKKEINKRNYEYVKTRLKKDPLYKVTRYLRSRVHNVTKGQKSAHTMELMGCSVEEFKLYLQAKFTKGMHWNNYGKWHIDHIRPCSSFNLLDPEEQKKCFHYINLQPLWASDNLKKSDTWEEKQYEHA